LVFKRRDRRPIWQVVLDFVYPRGGWGRAAQYVKHRVRRLPDTPEKIARGIWAGVFAAFSPFYGFHFIVAAVVAKVMRGNILASLMATFFGNPLTYIPIGVAALSTGHWVQDHPFDRSMLVGTKANDMCGLGCQFSTAFWDLWHNIKAPFGPEVADWRGLAMFYNEVFYPYMIGGAISGVIVATICYYICVPLIAAYQKRRRNALQMKLAQLGKKTTDMDDVGS
jgi:uncharacterized protein (DUF2062 family)